MNRLGGCIDSEIIAAVTIVGRDDRPLCNMDDKLTPQALIAQLAKAGREAQQVLGRMDHGAKARALVAAATALRQAETEVLAANAQDLAAGEANGLSPAMLDRLKLDPARLAGIADAVENVANLPDPVGEIIDSAQRPNGLSPWP